MTNPTSSKPTTTGNLTRAHRGGMNRRIAKAMANEAEEGQMCQRLKELFQHGSVRVGPLREGAYRSKWSLSPQQDTRHLLTRWRPG